jgi:adenosylcobinamide-phosphate synthase
MNITELLTCENLHNSLRIGAFSIGLAFILDLLIGDPWWLPHPVRLIGCFVSKLEFLLRKVFKGNIMERTGGILLVLIVSGITFLITSAISLILITSSSPDSFKSVSEREFLSSALFVFLISTTLATKSLLVSVRDVISKVKDGNTEEARRNLSMIVGRDTDNLNNEEILRAGLESLSENLSDGVVAPLFYLTIGGLPLVMTYKAINTMDSMVGYKNERYRYFGWAAARLDDILNFIPARLTSAFILLSVFFLETGKGIYRFFDEVIFRRPRPLRRLIMLFTVLIYDLLGIIWDAIRLGYYMAKRTFFVIMLFRKEHPSPNSGYPESALAGALGVRLGGPSYYGGMLVEKPFIGFSMRPMSVEVSEEGLRIIGLAAILAGISSVLVRL